MDTTSLATREPQHDTLLRSPDFLDVERFPVMTYKSRGIEHLADGYRVVGDLTIRDITREVVIDADFTGVATDPYGNARAAFSTEAAIDRKDFGLRWNVALDTGGALVGEKVKIWVEAEAVGKAAVLTEYEQAA